MTLLDRYLFAVGKHLPRVERDDILAELRDVVSTQIEAEGVERGRPLTEDDVAAILKRFGRPMTVAARYGGHNYLIGPVLYPAYLISLRILAWIFVPIAGLSTLLTAISADDVAGSVIKSALLALVMALANLSVVTMVFVLVDRRHRWEGPDDWDPRWLRPVPMPATPEPTPMSEAVCGFCLVTFYLLVWTGVLPFGRWIVEANRWLGVPLPYGLAPVWADVNLLIIALMLASMARDVVSVMRPHWVMLRASVGVALHVGALVVIVQLLRAGALFVVTNPAMPGADSIDSFNQLFRFIFFVAVVGVAASTAFALRRLVKMARSRPRGMMPATS